MIDLLGKEKAPVISTPYDPIHLTHVGFDYNTGQCESRRVSVQWDRTDGTDTGMPQEWQKLLDDNGITRAEQEQNPDQVSQRLQRFKALC
jgi:p21-activated kinase 1